jgi:hypothetical protein
LLLVVQVVVTLKAVAVVQAVFYQALASPLTPTPHIL